MLERSARSLPSPNASHDSPPLGALMLGGAGALPFVVLAIAAWTVAGSIGPVAIDGILTYGAVILSFIGGAHWGFASVRVEDDRVPKARWLLLASVLPSLVGWGALLFSPPWSALVLGCAFIAVVPLDSWARARALAPPWWMRLRLPLSAIAAMSLFVTGAATCPWFGS